MLWGAMIWIVSVSVLLFAVRWSYVQLAKITKTLCKAAFPSLRKGVGIGLKCLYWTCRLPRSIVAWCGCAAKGTERPTDYELEHTQERDSSARPELGYEEVFERMGIDPALTLLLEAAYWFMLLPLLGQWLFWIEFVIIFADR